MSDDNSVQGTTEAPDLPCIHPGIEALAGQVVVEMTVNKIVSELDDLMVLAADPETSRYVLGEAIGVGQILNRAQLVASFIEARRAPKLKVISNG